MSRRPFALLTLSLVTLALAACSDATAPTSSSQLRPAGKSNDVIVCPGGTLSSDGKC
jgi:hypothetical protein